MKVIDLLNKIANGEEVPKKIKFDNKEYENEPCYMLYEATGERNELQFRKFLNEPVEIPEEEKKIPEKLDKYADVSGDLAHEWTFGEKKLKDKINEIIDYLKENK